MKDKLTIIKVGGKIVEEESTLRQLLDDIKTIEGKKVLVHGGGRSATRLASSLGIETRMIDGRRVTDEAMLHIVTMVYAGSVNKNIVANLQARGINALGLTGADMDIIRSYQRPAQPVDFGYVGDIDKVDAARLAQLIDSGIMPVMAPLTHNGNGQLLNTNADTIAGETAKALAKHYDVTLIYLFEKAGVLRNENDEESVIPHITEESFAMLQQEGIVKGGMIPKLQNAFSAIEKGVDKVIITQANALKNKEKGTTVTKK